MKEKIMDRQVDYITLNQTLQNEYIYIHEGNEGK